MRRQIFTFVIISCLLCGAGCKDTDLTPAYLYITEEDLNNCVDVSTFNYDHDLNFDSEHLADLQKHSFTHVNVYVNNKNLGCWQLPCKVPVLHTAGSDSSVVVLLPAFKKTGMGRTISGYPFFNVLRQNLPLKAGETFNVSDNPPVYKYSAYARFPYFETFSNSSSFTPTDTSYSTHSFLPTVVDGRTVGEIVLHGATDRFDVSTTDIALPTYNYYVYLEVTYKTEGDIDIGMKLSTASSPNSVHQLGGIYASNGKWKTIYFDLSSIIHGYNYTGASITNANIIFSGNGVAGSNETHFQIDNVKVIYHPAA